MNMLRAFYIHINGSASMIENFCCYFCVCVCVLKISGDYDDLSAFIDDKLIEYE